MTPATASPRQTVTIAGNAPTDGCSASAGAQLTSSAALFAPDGFGPLAPRDAAGNFSTTFTIAPTTAAGSYSIGVRCGGGTVGVTATLTVVGPVMPTITVVPASASSGGAVVVSGLVPPGGCGATDRAQLTSTADLFPPDGFGPQATRDPNGAFSVPYTVPAATSPGVYQIGIRCGGGTVGVTATLQITRAATPSSSVPSVTTLAPPTSVSPTTAAASSGNSSGDGWWIAVAVVVLVVAIAAVVTLLGRRRGLR